VAASRRVNRYSFADGFVQKWVVGQPQYDRDLVQEKQKQPTTMSQSDPEKSQLFNWLDRVYVLFAIFGVIFGAIHLLSILSSSFTTSRLGDALIKTFMGIAAFACSRVLRRSNRLVILLQVGLTIMTIAYAFAVGRGFNVVSAVVGTAILAALVVLGRRGELA
jgi:hypothetical protein